MDDNFNNNENLNNNNNFDYNPYNPYRSTSPQNGYGYHSQEAYSSTNNTEVKTEKKTCFSGLGATLVKTVAVALVFGLVAGTTATAVLQFSGLNLGVFSDMEDDSEDNRDDSTKDENSESERTPSGSLQQTNTDVQTTVAVMDVSDIVNNVMPCVVAISNIGEVKYQGMWGQSYTQETESAGTGFLVEQDADFIYIATNNHVVADAKKLTVQFCDGTTADAEIKGVVASKDLAVIKVAIADIDGSTKSTIRIATLGDSTQLEAGEPAIAIGNALGYGQSVTVGYISALGRSVSVQDSSTGTTVVNNNLIQTDAAINPGNSGGALLNINGEVIGINSVKYADTDVEGIGYAIPINDAMLIIDKLIDGEKIDESQSGYLGIQGKDSSLGVYVHSVIQGSAAQKAGIESGDIIIEFEGTTIATMSQLKELLTYYPAGEKVDFVILRPQGNDEYKEIGITVELGDASILNAS